MPVWAVKALAVGPGVIVSVVVVAITLAAAPTLASLSAALVVAGLAAVAGLRTTEGLAAAVLLGARQVRPSERTELAAVLTQLCRAELGPPLVEVRVKRSQAIGAFGAGRRTVVVSTALIEAVAIGDLPPRQAAAVIAHAAVLVREGLTRTDMLIGCVTATWRLARATILGISAWCRRLPLTQAAWRARVVVVTVAVVQAVQLGQVGFSVVTAAIGAVSYALPRWERNWQALLVRTGDEGVARAGLGDPLVEFLRACPRTDATRVRLRTLVATDRQRPPLGLVTR